MHRIRRALKAASSKTEEQHRQQKLEDWNLLLELKLRLPEDYRRGGHIHQYQQQVIVL